VFTLSTDDAAQLVGWSYGINFGFIKDIGMISNLILCELLLIYMVTS